MTHNASVLRALLRDNGLTPRRAFGQNFVADPNTVRRIARLSGVGPGDHVVEVGAGLGSLTLALAETGASVLALEVDRALVSVLTTVVAAATVGSDDDRPPVDVIEADARAVDWNDMLAGAESWDLVANLPYNIATPLVLDVLRDVDRVRSLTVLVQREAGERLAAGPGGRTRGIPSVMVEAQATARIIGAVPAAVFVPRPKVESVIVRVDRRCDGVTGDSLTQLDRVVRPAFAHRRKMLRRSLADRLTTAQFDDAGVDPARRPEELTLTEWLRLAAAAS